LSPKLTGLRHLLEATRDDDLRSLVVFASASGRYGRRGQSDYAVANQALVSIATAEASRRPRCRVVALDWGPWEGGMVTPALRQEFTREGVPLIPLDVGAAAMCDEALSAPGGPVEVVLGAGFGGDVDASSTLAASWALSVPTLPFLRDHTLAGKPVLPLAVTLDWFASAIVAVLGAPPCALEDVRVFRGVTVGSEPHDVSIWVGSREVGEGTLRVPVELRGAEGVVHVRAMAAVGSAEPSPPPMSAEALRPFPTTVARLYSEQLFHGPSLEAIRAIDGISESGMVLQLATQAAAGRLVPGHSSSPLDPLVLDGVFQGLIVWCREHLGVPSLPSRIGALRIFAPLVGNSARAVVRIRAVDGMSVSSDVDLVDETGEVCARLEEYVCTGSASLHRAFVSDGAAMSPSAA
jgi:hypothetical protein